MNVKDSITDSQKTLTERASATSRSTWASVAVNLTLTIAQIAIGIVAKSQALVADGIHSLSDLLGDFVVLAAGRQSRKSADEDHPYGHQRFETAASLVLGLLLLAVAGGMLWAAIGKLNNRGLVPHVHQVALWMAIGTLVAKELLFRYLMAVARRVRSTMLMANAWHSRSDAASSFVVVLGIAGNLAGYSILDPIAALIVALMVARMGGKFVWTAMNELMDHSADNEEVEAIRRTLLGTPGVRNVHDVRTRKMGDMILADAHIEVDASITVEQGHEIAVAARERVLQLHRVLDLMTHIDPWRKPDRDHADR
ncbi:MAG: cation diffusion facilitator family transporter [Burkholderiaceae bacterium]